MKKIILRSLFLLFLMPLTVSVDAAEVLKQGKDTKSGLGYTVILDPDFLTIAYDFSGPMRLGQMAHNGFTVYINEAGKKKMDMGLIVEGVRPPRPKQAPVNSNNEMSLQDFKKNSLQIDSLNRPNRLSLKDIHFEKCFWQVDKENRYDIDLQNPQSGFKVYIDETKNRCVVVIPVNAINENGLKKPNKMMIGLISENSFKPDFKNRPSTSNGAKELGEASEGFDPSKRGEMPGENGMGMPRGAGRPGMGMPGGPGRPGMRSLPGQNGQAGISTKIELWFNCK